MIHSEDVNVFQRDKEAKVIVSQACRMFKSCSQCYIVLTPCWFSWHLFYYALNAALQGDWRAHADKCTSFSWWLCSSLCRCSRFLKKFQDLRKFVCWDFGELNEVLIRVWNNQGRELPLHLLRYLIYFGTVTDLQKTAYIRYCYYSLKKTKY